MNEHNRRVRAGEDINPIPLLRDIDQPYIFSINLGSKSYRFEFYDTSSPENWRLLDPDVVVICYDISQRLSLINMKRYVSTWFHLFPDFYCPRLLLYSVRLSKNKKIGYLQLIHIMHRSGSTRSSNRFPAWIPCRWSSWG